VSDIALTLAYYCLAAWSVIAMLQSILHDELSFPHPTVCKEDCKQQATP